MVEHDPDGSRPRRAVAGPEPADQSVDADSTAPAPDQDEPRPLFRDEPVDAGPAAGSGSRRRLTFVPQRPSYDDEHDEDATTVLPRAAASRRERFGSGSAFADEVDDELADAPRLGRGTRLALLVGAVAVVIVAGLAVIFAVAGGGPAGRSLVAPSPATSSDPSAASPTAPALLDDTELLDPVAARPIAPQRTWTIRDTVRGQSAEAPGPACLGTDPLEGVPTPQQKITRTLTTGGQNPPQALHLAQVYASPADAAQAFAVTSRALGECRLTGDYLASGRVVQGAGDEGAGALITSVQGAGVTGHSVLVSRTGRVLDLVDASQPTRAPNVNTVAAALATVVNSQCAKAGGACANQLTVSDGPPPAGGDEPGFLTLGDLPPVGKNRAPWIAAPVEAPEADFAGSSCETVSWDTVAAQKKTTRVYLLEGVPGVFGLNEIKLTTKDPAAAQKLVQTIRSDWTSCAKRKLTATVTTPVPVTGVGAGKAPITGYTATVEQKAGDTTTRYRVGIAATGDQAVFTFLNPTDGLDLSQDQWNEVAVRAVQRATQAG